MNTRPASPHGLRAPLRQAPVMAITVDLHDVDDPDDIRIASEELGGRAIAATFFLPSAMLARARYREAARLIVADGHEVGNHSHNHSQEEMRALMHGKGDELEFLSFSKAIHEDFFGASPTAFRSPGWCHLGRAAIGHLTRLGYTVDSSATPQRLGILSSTPFENVWTLSSRRLHFLSPSLLEVPTSSLFVPAGAPSFLTFPACISRALVKCFAMETRLLASRVLTLQFHAGFFNASANASYRPRTPLSLSDFKLRQIGGFGFRAYLRKNGAPALARLTTTLLDDVSEFRSVTLSSVSDLASTSSSCRNRDAYTVRGANHGAYDPSTNASTGEVGDVHEACVGLQ